MIIQGMSNAGSYPREFIRWIIDMGVHLSAVMQTECDVNESPISKLCPGQAQFHQDQEQSFLQVGK